MLTDHGRESSASTGKLAALRLPFFVSPPKLIELSATGASMSISSSMSDMVAKDPIGRGCMEKSEHEAVQQLSSK